MKEATQPITEVPGEDLEWPMPAAPYPGLRAFEKSEWPIFFGRETMTQDVVGLLVKKRLMAVHGDSGCGKSSLIRAGVLPFLERDQARIGGSWRTVEMRPGDTPLDNLAQALGELLTDAGSSDASLIRILSRAEHAPAALAKLLGCSATHNVCILFDQFEELFEHARKERPIEAEIIIAFLVGLARDPPLGLHAIITLRSDYLGQCARWQGFAETINDTQYLVPRMERPALWRAIQEPAALYGGYATPELADALIADAGSSQDQLPLIQHGLMQLWREKTGGNPEASNWRLELDDYRARGGLRSILSHHADKVLEQAMVANGSLSDAGAADNARIAETIFRTLTGRNAEGQPIRRRVKLHDIAAVAGTSEERIRAVLAPFRAAGVSFIRPYEGEVVTSDTGFDISHEAFIRNWQRIADETTGWLKRESDDGLRWTSLRLAATDWDGGDRGLLSAGTAEAGEKLIAAANPAWAERYGNAWDKVERLVAESRRAVEAAAEAIRRRAALDRTFAGAAVLVALGMMVLAIFSYRQYQRAAAAEAEAFRQTESALKAAMQAQRAQDEAERQAAAAGRNETILLTNLSKVEADEGRQVDAVKLALAGLPRTTDEKRPPLRRALAAFALALPMMKERQRWVHEADVTSAAFSPDGRQILTGSKDKTARLWDATTGAALGVPMRHDGGIVFAAFSPNGKRVVTASEDQTARLWDAATGTAIGAPMRHDGTVWRAAFSPDGTRVVTASSDGTARLWDAATGVAVGAPMRHDGMVLSVAFSPNGDRVVTASSDKTARLWVTVTGAAMGEPMRHEGEVRSASFSPDGNRVATASSDQTARLWDAATGKAILGPIRHETTVFSVEFSPDGKRLLTASSDQTARLWNATTAGAIGAPMRHERAVFSAAFSPDGNWVVTASSDETARLWDAATAEAVGTPMRHEGPISSAVFSPDGSGVVTASSDMTARLWDVGIGAAVGAPMRHESTVWSTAFSPNGAQVVTASGDNTARLWDAATGLAIGAPMRHDGTVWRAAFSRDGKRVVTASSDGTARLWDTATGVAVGQPLQHGRGVKSAAFSPDGSRVVTVSADGEVQLWDAATSAAVGAPLPHHGWVGSAVFSPDGSRVLTASEDKTARLWDAVSGATIGVPMQHDGVVLSAVFSPDGIRVVTASSDGTARLWDPTTGAPIGAPMRHEKRVWFATFSPDGGRVVSASDDRKAHLWDAATGAPIGAPMRHEGEVYSAVFSPSGSRVVTASEDRTARLWDVATGVELARWQMKDGVDSAIFAPDSGRLLIAGVNVARIFDISAIGTGDAFAIACRRLGNNADLSSSIQRWALGKLVPICGGNPSLPWDWSKTED